MRKHAQQKLKMVALKQLSVLLMPIWVNHFDDTFNIQLFMLPVTRLLLLPDSPEIHT